MKKPIPGNRRGILPGVPAYRGRLALEMILQMPSPPDGDALLNAVGITRERLYDPEGRITLMELAMLYEKAAVLTGDRDFGLHLGAQCELTAGRVGAAYGLLFESTLGDMLLKLLKPLYQDFGVPDPDGDRGVESFELLTDSSRARFVYMIDDKAVRRMRHRAECSAVMFLRGIRRATGADIRFREVRFTHATPGKTYEHERLIGAPCLFEQQFGEIVLDRDLLDLPLKEADPELARTVEEHVAAKPQIPDREPLADRLRRAVTANPKGEVVELAGLAKKLAVSPRTLQRMLRQEGVSFREIVARARADVAKRHLVEGTLSIGEVAEIMGYQDIGSFHRAFKRWTGQTPTHYRKHHGRGWVAGERGNAPQTGRAGD